MTHIRAIARDTALCLLPLIGAGFWVDGWFGALGVLATGAVVLGNLFVLGRLVPRLTGLFAGTDPAGSLAGVFFVLKLPILVGLVTGLAMVFGGAAVGLGLSSVVFSVFVRGLLLAMAPPPAPESAASQGS